MKKSLIALAALSAFGTAAQAQSSVTVYGVLDASYLSSATSYGAGLEVNQKNVGGIDSGNGTGTLSGSRLGFRGTEDLGGGLKANFVFESGIRYSNGGSATSVAAANDDATATNGAGFQGVNVRQGWLGLSGNFGEVRIGTHESLSKISTEMIDPLAGVALTGVFAQSGLPTTRPTNSITYFSPRVSGLQLQVQYDEGESNQSTTVGKDNYATAYSVNYAAGNFTAVASVDSRKKVGYAANAALVDLPANDIVHIGAGSSAQQVDKVEHKAFGATYTISGVKLAAMQTEIKTKDDVAANAGKIKANLLGATIPVNNKFNVFASLSDGEIVDNGSKTHDLRGYQLVGVYSLSKRTNAYIAYGQSTYDSPTANSDVEIKQTAVGLRHSF